MNMPNLKFLLIGAAIASFVFSVTVLTGCSDSNDVAGGVTDIGNSVATGIVLDVAGTPVARARVVAYYDSWQQDGIEDSVETVTDAEGKFELNLDGNKAAVLFASAGDSSGFAKLVQPKISARSTEQQTVTIAQHKIYSGQIADRNTGIVRIVGSNATTKLDADGYFIFYDMPSGDITLTYSDTSASSDNGQLQSHLEFNTYGEKQIYVLPKMNFWEADTSWLTVSRMEHYSEKGHDGIIIAAPESEDWTPASSASAPASSDSAINLLLTMDGSESVYDNDTTPATKVEYVEGVSGKAILLKPGQFISLDSLDPTGGNFTLSLWTKWNGTNGKHQILFSQRAYWSDSTSRFQWHFEHCTGWFTAMKSTPGDPYAIYFGDSSIVPVGKWSHLALISRNKKVSMYVNGEVMHFKDEKGDDYTEWKFVPNDLKRKVPFRVGGDEVSTETWNGAIDEVLIETVAHDANWVKEQYKKYTK